MTEMRLIELADRSNFSIKTLFWKVSSNSSVIKFPLRMTFVRFGKPFNSIVFILQLDKSISRNDSDWMLSSFLCVKERRWFPLKFTKFNSGICENTDRRSIANLHSLTSKLVSLPAIKSGRVCNGFDFKIKWSKFTNTLNINEPVILWIWQSLKSSHFRLPLIRSISSFPLNAPSGLPAKLNVSKLVADSMNVFGLRLIHSVILLYDRIRWRRLLGKITSFDMISILLYDKSSVSNAKKLSSLGGNLVRPLYETSNFSMAFCKTKCLSWDISAKNRF